VEELGRPAAPLGEKRSEIGRGQSIGRHGAAIVVCLEQNVLAIPDELRRAGGIFFLQVPREDLWVRVG